jgi:hypothetical protein
MSVIKETKDISNYMNTSKEVSPKSSIGNVEMSYNHMYSYSFYRLKGGEGLYSGK